MSNKIFTPNRVSSIRSLSPSEVVKVSGGYASMMGGVYRPGPTETRLEQNYEVNAYYNPFFSSGTVRH